MKATVLIDNIGTDNLVNEWGLSIFVEYKDKKVLLDTGKSNKFLENAEKLGADIAKVDYGVLSHAHYDHADGLETFFTENKNANFYLQKGSKENCYKRVIIFNKYIGIKKGTLEKYKDRIIFAEGDYEISPGIMLLPHKTSGLEAIGKKKGMYVKRKNGWYPDDFSHEQSLVFDTEKGLVIFNSCSHGGADNIINEVSKTYPDKKIYAIIGGFHLFSAKESEVRELAKRIEATKIEKVYTGHCTGQNSYNILKEELGDKIEQLRTGLTIEF